MRTRTLTRKTLVRLLLLSFPLFVFLLTSNPGLALQDEVSTIRFLDSSQEALEIDYGDLLEGKARLQAAVVNDSPDSIIIEGNILLPGLKTIQDGQASFSSEALFMSQPISQTLAAGRSAILEFVPSPDAMPADGEYAGFLVVTDATHGTAISRALKVSVALAPSPEVTADFEILNAQALRVDYDSLASGLLTIAVRNRSEQDVQLTGVLTIANVTDRLGNPFELNFDLGEVGEDGKFVKKAALLLPKNGLTPLNFSLVKLPGDPAPGIYTGTLTLTALDAAHTSRSLTFPLFIPNAKITLEIVGESKTYNYFDLLPDPADESIIPRRIVVVVRNKGQAEAQIKGAIIVAGILDEDGNPLELQFGEGTFTVPSESAGFLAFELKQPGKAPLPGDYTGLIQLTAQDGARAEQTFTLNVPAPAIEIVDAAELSYDYVDLASKTSPDYIAVRVRNKSAEPVKLDTAIEVQRDLPGQDDTRIQLDFQRITLADEGQMTDDSQVQVAEGPFEVKARETAWLYFTLSMSSLTRKQVNVQ
ncbi:MAG: hypothetical protein AB1894_29655 [Chloroflexota bacterium]